MKRTAAFVFAPSSMKRLAVLAIVLGLLVVPALAGSLDNGASNFFLTQSLTPTATGATIGVAEQTFTVNGLLTTDRLAVTGPAPTALCPMVGARVSAGNTLQIDFAVMTAVACTPASGSYKIQVFR